MYKFEDNEKTQLSFEYLLEIDTEDEKQDLPGIEYIETFDQSTPFRDGIDERIKSLGFTGYIDSVQEKLAFLQKQFVKNEVDEVSKPTLKNWLTASAPDDSGRENVFKLCFALEMNARETIEFFLKKCLTRPFNYKSPSEAVYFYCLLNGKNYQEAKQLIEEMHSMPNTRKGATERATEEIGAELCQIGNEEELLKYLSLHKYDVDNYHVTATNRIKELRQRCYKDASAESEWLGGEARSVTSDDELFDAIYGYDSAAMEKEKRNINSSRFPKAIRDCWPNRQLLFNVTKHSARKENVFRKLLILFTFYDYYVNAYAAERKNNRCIDLRSKAEEFEMELDQVLAECGYIQLYKRNPYDWLFYYCSSFQDPISKFRDVIDEYYLQEGG